MVIFFENLLKKCKKRYFFTLFKQIILLSGKKKCIFKILITRILTNQKKIFFTKLTVVLLFYLTCAEVAKVFSSSEKR
jgi:hypothetical protein